MSTSAGWDGVLNGIINEEDCEIENEETGVAGNCGNMAMGIAFLLTKLFTSNRRRARRFDPNGTQYLKYNALSDFLDVLEPPLQIHKPNKYKIVSMDIPICKKDLCYCVDVLDALTKDFFARKGNPVEETVELGEVTAQSERPGYDPISSTLWRQREDYCARLIQRAWKKKNIRNTFGGSLSTYPEGITPRSYEHRRRSSSVIHYHHQHTAPDTPTAGVVKAGTDAVSVVLVHPRSSSIGSAHEASFEDSIFCQSKHDNILRHESCFVTLRHYHSLRTLVICIPAASLRSGNRFSSSLSGFEPGFLVSSQNHYGSLCHSRQLIGHNLEGYVAGVKPCNLQMLFRITNIAYISSRITAVILDNWEYPVY
ncbi:SCN2A [Lepeophtheirus salmonis]|uniref:SCN2A n=1 Tax=Lepeophtheirus salmonis TaxID=72036 RepID=A0A7R8CKR0_LEPSM|nr:SCN2A [Lepeophtheirus salmonis]CAF2847470.1 SCN2A [Lepeophtheirus salmonis]